MKESTSLLDQVNKIKDQLLGDLSELTHAHGLLSVMGGGALFLLYKCWTNWPEIKKKPGVATMVSALMRRPVPKAPPGHLTVAVMQLDGDTNRGFERLIVAELAQFAGVEVMRVPRVLKRPEEPLESVAEMRANSKVRKLIAKTRADVVIWGSVIAVAGRSVLQLRVADSNDSQTVSRMIPNAVDCSELPAMFWSELTGVLSLLVRTRLCGMIGPELGSYTTEEFKRVVALAAQVKDLLKNPPQRWDEQDRANLQYAAARALLNCARQAGPSSILADSISLFRECARHYRQAPCRMKWAPVALHLANALHLAGERRACRRKLWEAIGLYGDVLNVYTENGARKDWATAANNLAVALSALAELEPGTKSLEEADEIFDKIIRGRTETDAPIDLAFLQHNRASVLYQIGARLRDRGQLRVAEEACRAALKLLSPDRAPFQWADTMCTLGNVLRARGTLESDVHLLCEAAVTLQKALEIQLRVRVPLQWALTTMSLGLVEAGLGELENNTERFKRAAALYQDCIKELPRYVLPFEWAKVNHNLAVVLHRLGELEPKGDWLLQARKCHYLALEVHTENDAPYLWAMTLFNLGATLARLGERDETTASLELARDAYQSALTVFKTANATHYIELIGTYINVIEEEIEERMARSVLA